MVVLSYWLKVVCGCFPLQHRVFSTRGPQTKRLVTAVPLVVWFMLWAGHISWLILFHSLLWLLRSSELTVGIPNDRPSHTPVYEFFMQLGISLSQLSLYMDELVYFNNMFGAKLPLIPLGMQLNRIVAKTLDFRAHWASSGFLTTIGVGCLLRYKFPGPTPDLLHQKSSRQGPEIFIFNRFPKPSWNSPAFENYSFRVR